MNKSVNILPIDGNVEYYGAVYDKQSANHYFDYLLKSIAWKHDEAFIYGKHIITARKVAWYGDTQLSYKYSGKTRIALDWTPELFKIKQDIQNITGVDYNSCLLNLYEDGTQGMGWHSDDEKELGKDNTIASLSLGAERRFDIRHKGTKEKVMIHLEHGSLLVMSGKTQSHWQHQIPKMLKIKSPRINLTFRKIL